MVAVTSQPHSVLLPFITFFFSLRIYFQKMSARMILFLTGQAAFLHCLKLSCVFSAHSEYHPESASLPHLISDMDSYLLSSQTLNLHSWLLLSSLRLCIPYFPRPRAPTGPHPHWTLYYLVPSLSGAAFFFCAFSDFYNFYWLFLAPAIWVGGRCVMLLKTLSRASADKVSALLLTLMYLRLYLGRERSVFSETNQSSVVSFIGSPVTSSAGLQTPGGHYFMDLHHINKFEKGKKFLRVSLHCRAFGVPKSWKLLPLSSSLPRICSRALGCIVLLSHLCLPRLILVNHQISWLAHMW